MSKRVKNARTKADRTISSLDLIGIDREIEETSRKLDFLMIKRDELYENMRGKTEEEKLNYFL